MANTRVDQLIKWDSDHPFAHGAHFLLNNNKISTGTVRSVRFCWAC